MFSPKYSFASILIASISFSLPLCSGQVIVWDQQPDTSLTVIDLEIAEPAAIFSTYVLNDVVFSTNVDVSSVTTYFSNTSGTWEATITEARLCIFAGDFTPFDPSVDGEIVPVTVTDIGNGVLAVTASKLRIPLNAGVHWIGLTPVFDDITLPQELRFDTGNTVGDDSFFRNPGNGFGLGADWMNADLLAPGFSDAAITIQEAVLTPPSFFPQDATVLRGFEVSGEFDDVCASDDTRWVFNPGFVLNSSEAPVWIEFEAEPIVEFDVFIESQAGTPGLTLTIEEFNFSTGVFEVIAEESESFNVDVERRFETSGHESDSGLIRFRAGWRQTGLTMNFPWEIRIDSFFWLRDTLP